MKYELHALGKMFTFQQGTKVKWHAPGDNLVHTLQVKTLEDITFIFQAPKIAIFSTVHGDIAFHVPKEGIPVWVRSVDQSISRA